jgi:hypothetical protein
MVETRSDILQGTLDLMVLEDRCRSRRVSMRLSRSVTSRQP